MKTQIKGFILAVAVLFVAAGCSFGPYTPDTPDATAVIQLRMPQSALFNSPASRAMSLGPDKVTFILKKSGTEVDRQTVTPDDETAVLSVTPDTGYTLEALVYNTLTDPDRPVVRGESEVFDAAAGMTIHVPIVCLPENPVTLETGTGTEVTLTPLVGSYGTGLDSPGQEAWFTYTTGATEESILFTVTPTDPAMDGHYLLIFNSMGYYEEGFGDYDAMTETDGPFLYLFPCIPDTTYYVNALAMTMMAGGTTLFYGGPFTLLAEAYVRQPVPVEHSLSVGTWDSEYEAYVVDIPADTTDFIATLTLTSTSVNPVNVQLSSDWGADATIAFSLDPETLGEPSCSMAVATAGTSVYLSSNLYWVPTGGRGVIEIYSDDPFAMPVCIPIQFNFLPAEP